MCPAWLFQASIIIRRKESKAEELQEAREELAAAEREWRQRNSKAQVSDGEDGVRDDEVRRFSQPKMNTVSEYQLNFLEAVLILLAAPTRCLCL